MSMGSRIQALRIQNGLSQESLAELIGVTRQSISRWELGETSPDTKQIVKLATLFGITTDWLLLQRGAMHHKRSPQSLRFGMYLIVKDFDKAVDFYEKLLGICVNIVGRNRFAQFFFDGICMSIMNEAALPGHDYSSCGHHKFAINLYAKNLEAEHERIKALGIGQVSDITRITPHYQFFMVRDPDRNVVEITGQ